jgi:serine/threonine protein kinase
MFCSRCGSEITGKSKFCPSCGLDLMATTPVHAIATGVLQELDLVRESLAAEYEIIEELGRGGMAMVYRAKDRQLEREVAVKVLPFSLAFDTEFVERFQREARTAAQLEHPNIISIYRVGRSGRVIYFVMKFLRGGSVSTSRLQRFAGCSQRPGARWDTLPSVESCTAISSPTISCSMSSVRAFSRTSASQKLRPARN